MIVLEKTALKTTLIKDLPTSTTISHPMPLFEVTQKNLKNDYLLSWEWRGCDKHGETSTSREVQVECSCDIS